MASYTFTLNNKNGKIKDFFVVTAETMGQASQAAKEFFVAHLEDGDYMELYSELEIKDYVA